MQGLTPYATAFQWRLFASSYMYDTKVNIDGVELNMTMTQDDPYSKSASWTFSFFLPKHDFLALRVIFLKQLAPTQRSVLTLDVLFAKNV